MVEDSRRPGTWLAGSGLSFAALYLIGTAPVGHGAPVFPYWVFLAMFAIGALAFGADGRPSRKAQAPRAVGSGRERPG